VLSGLEREQHGLVAIDQLPEEWTAGAIKYRVRGTRMRVARGVLAHPSVRQTFEQRALASVLAGGDGAFASHETAAKIWKLPLTAPALIEITVPLQRRPRVRGVRVHRSGLLEALDVMTVDGIPVSTPELTIYSISSRNSVRVLGRMVDDALRSGVTTIGRLTAIVERLPPAPGRSAKRMRAVLSLRAPDVGSRESVLEDFVFAALLRFELPLPVPQHRVMYKGQVRRVDLCYPDDELALEAKGFRWYRERSGWDRDALRGNELQLAGYRVLSFTSAFSDWDIALQVAAALGLPQPRPRAPRSFADWVRNH
jgi:hypothetical protein